jgi:hypothetical protein
MSYSNNINFHKQVEIYFENNKELFFLILNRKKKKLISSVQFIS